MVLHPDVTYDAAAFQTAMHAKAIDLIKLSVEMTTAAGAGHPTSAASLAHLVTVLMYAHMRYDPSEPAHPAADRLVLSEGHACPIVYAAAADLGMTIKTSQGIERPMTRDDALQLRAIDSPIDGHPNPAEGFNFFPAATGSLGQGLSIAAGLALAAGLDGSDKHIFCLIGDGESREGQIWEAIDFLADYHLHTVCPIFNCNGYGQSDPVSQQQTATVTAAKLRGAGFDVYEIDGHTPVEIRRVLRAHATNAVAAESRLMAIVARTKKAWGFDRVLGSEAHGKPVPEEDLPRALAALDATAQELGAMHPDHAFRPLPFEKTMPEGRASVAPLPGFVDALKRYGQEGALEKGKMATRKAYGVALQALGHASPHVVALDGDVKNSTYAEYFHDDTALQERFFEARIAEQNMLSCAAGLAAGGKIPFVSTFGKFMTRAYDQLEMAVISRANLKLVGSHVGVSLASDGPSQMALTDVAFFRSLSTVHNRAGEPMMVLLNPADAYAAYALTLAMAAHNGPCYMRTLRPDVPLLYDEMTRFAIGGHHVLETGHDLLIVASGYMVHEALKALPHLKDHGIGATLVDLYSLPFDTMILRKLAQDNQGLVLTLEDNYGAGIGSAVAEALLEQGGNYTLKQMHVSKIPKSARTPDDIMRYVGLAAEDITRTAIGMLETVVSSSASPGEPA